MINFKMCKVVLIRIRTQASQSFCFMFWLTCMSNLDSYKFKIFSRQVCIFIFNKLKVKESFALKNINWLTITNLKCFSKFFQEFNLMNLVKCYNLTMFHCKNTVSQLKYSCKMKCGK